MSVDVELSCGQLRLGLAFELRHDALGQHFAQLDSPLIERIDVPDRSLHEDLVLVEGDQLAQRRGGEQIEHQRIGRMVARKRAVRHLEGGHAVGLDLGRGLAKGQGFGLGKEIGHQQIVMNAQRVERAA